MDILSYMSQVGLRPARKIEILEDWLIHRYQVEGDSAGSRNGWYIGNGEVVKLGSWKTGQTHVFFADGDRKFSPDEEQELRNEMARVRREREEGQRKAIIAANELWLSSPAAFPNHSYLVNKQIVPYDGVRQTGDNLIVPVCNSAGRITSLQHIAPNGSKWFFAKGRVKGGRFLLGLPDADVIVVVEGYATGCSLYDVLREQYNDKLLIAVAFFAGNLKPVALSLRTQYPEARIIIGADNDRFSEVNTGLLKAREAADAVGAQVICPDFPEDMAGTDWNDLITRIRDEERKRC